MSTTSLDKNNKAKDIIKNSLMKKIQMMNTLDLSNVAETDRESPEVKVMTKLKHKNLIPLYKVIYEDNKLCLVMEL